MYVHVYIYIFNNRNVLLGFCTLSLKIANIRNTIGYHALCLHIYGEQYFKLFLINFVTNG